jgi:hypothetical protein
MSRQPAAGGLDTNLRPVIAPPPIGDGIRTEPGTTHRNGMPERHPYHYLDGEDVAEPAEIVRRLRKLITDANPGLGPWDCCECCEHDAADPPHAVRCPGGCNDGGVTP